MIIAAGESSIEAAFGPLLIIYSDLGKIILGNLPKVAFVYFVGGVGIDIYIEANIFYRIWVGETNIGLEKWDSGTKTIVWSMPTV